MTQEKIRAAMKDIEFRVSDTAAKADLFYVICFWFSPVTENVEHRTGYFDEISEAIAFETMLEQTYNKFNFKWHIVNNTTSVNLDGGLLHA